MCFISVKRQGFDTVRWVTIEKFNKVLLLALGKSFHYLPVAYVWTYQSSFELARLEAVHPSLANCNPVPAPARVQPVLGINR